jgi:hypothetical protein
MAEIEYEGVKVSGGKLLMIIPLLSALGGALWTGFEFYNRLMVAEETLASIDIAAITAEVDRLDSIYELVQNDLNNQISSLTTQSQNENASIRAEMVDFSRLLREVEGSTSETQRELRNDIYALEREINERMREIDSDLIEMRDYLEEQIQEILTNPLNNIE